MGDSKTFWRETIGAGVAPRGSKPAPRPAAPAPGTARPAPPAAVPEDGTAPPSPTRRPAVVPGSIAVGSRSAEMPAPYVRAKSAALEALELVLGSLPVGSINFSEQVGARLWPDPLPAEVRDLARLIVARHELAELEARDALIRAVAVRQRTRRLRRVGPEVPLEAAAFAARAQDWARLAEVAGEVRLVLQAATGPRGVDAIAAGLALLPDPLELAAEADIARAAATLIEVARGGAARGAHQELPPVDDAVALLGAAKAGAARPGDPLLLEIWAACSLVRRDLPRAERDVLEHDRRVLALVEARAERTITHAVETEGSDREAARRLLAWRRYLAEMADRIQARLDPPKPPSPAPAKGQAPAAAAPAKGQVPVAAAAPAEPAPTPGQGLLFRATSTLVGLFKR